MPEKSAALMQTHQVRITNLLHASRRVERIVIVLYLAVFCGGCLLMLFAGRTLHREIAVPLQGLAGMAHRIADGRLEARVPVTTRDEIGQLSYAFNVMANRLQDRERELQEAQGRLRRKIQDLEALNEIASGMLAFNEPGGPDTIFRLILEKARELLHAEAAAICLRETDSEEMVLHSTSGPAEAFRVMSGALHPPAAYRQEGRHAIPCCSVIDPEYARSHLASPLNRGQESIGMLCVATREERTFSKEETDLLYALAAQAAITLEHGRLDAEVHRLAMLEERGRIARDMHDGLAQSLGLLYMKIRQAQAQIPPGQFAPLGNAMEEMAVISSDMYEEVRRAIYGLRTMVSHERDVIPALTEFLREFGEQNHLPVRFESPDVQAVRVSPGVEVQLVRIIQEALRNVRRHAKATQALVRVERQNASLRVSVEDDGCGFDPSRFASTDGVHFGLQGMRERAERLGGTLEIACVPGQGTRVTVTLPVENPS
jgi:two-component system nitrate/nitrite sensor histidine kinase NarX